MHHLISAGARRQALARATGGDAAAALRCTDERLRRFDRNDKRRAMQLLLPWPRVQKQGRHGALRRRNRTAAAPLRARTGPVPLQTSTMPL